MDRRLILVRSAAVAVWIAALISSATEATEWPAHFEHPGLFDLPSALIAVAAVVTAVCVPFCLMGTLGVALWIAGDIWMSALGRPAAPEVFK